MLGRSKRGMGGSMGTRTQGNREEFHETASYCAWRRYGDGCGCRIRPRQDLRAAPVALGAAVASLAEGAGGLGLLDREGLERDDQVQGLSLAAARQGVRPLRHGA